MTDEDAIDIVDNPARETQCLEYLKASVQATRAITLEVGGKEMSHEAEPIMLAALLTAEVIFLNSHWWEKTWPEEARKKTALCVNCSDVFVWACAEVERIDYKEIEDLYDHWLRDPRWGAAVWCMKKRGKMPQKPVEDRIRADGIWDLDTMGLAPNIEVAHAPATQDETGPKDRQE